MHGTLISMSEQQLVDCDFSDHGCFGGLPGPAWRYVNQAGGIESEENYPYDGKDGKCQFDLDNSTANVAGCVGSIGPSLPVCVRGPFPCTHLPHGVCPSVTAPPAAVVSHVRIT